VLGGEFAQRASEESKYLSPDTLLDYGWKLVAQQQKNDPAYRVKRIGEGKGDMNYAR
jgi:hypothetical protein